MLHPTSTGSGISPESGSSESFFHNKTALLLCALLAVILCSSCLGVWYLYSRGNQPADSATGTIAELYQDGKLIKRIDLDAVTEPYTFKVEDTEDDYNIVEVHPGEIGITEASCPDKICIYMGFVNTPGIPITCLPNRLVIRIVQDDPAEDGLDSVVY